MVQYTVVRASYLNEPKQDNPLEACQKYISQVILDLIKLTIETGHHRCTYKHVNTYTTHTHRDNYLEVEELAQWVKELSVLLS